MTLMRIRQPSLKKRLLQRRPEIMNQKLRNLIWESEVRKNWAVNAQGLHDTYAGEIRNNMPRQPYADSVANHRARLERMLRESGMFVDPLVPSLPY